MSKIYFNVGEDNKSRLVEFLKENEISHYETKSGSILINFNKKKPVVMSKMDNSDWKFYSPIGDRFRCNMVVLEGDKLIFIYHGYECFNYDGVKFYKK